MHISYLSATIRVRRYVLWLGVIHLFVCSTVADIRLQNPNMWTSDYAVHNTTSETYAEVILHRISNNKNPIVSADDLDQYFIENTLNCDLNSNILTEYCKNSQTRAKHIYDMYCNQSLVGSFFLLPTMFKL